jgi:hypothetical protein
MKFCWSCEKFSLHKFGLGMFEPEFFLREQTGLPTGRFGTDMALNKTLWDIFRSL